MRYLIKGKIHSSGSIKPRAFNGAYRNTLTALQCLCSGGISTRHRHRFTPNTGSLRAETPHTILHHHI